MITRLSNERFFLFVCECGRVEVAEVVRVSVLDPPYPHLSLFVPQVTVRCRCGREITSQLCVWDCWDIYATRERALQAGKNAEKYLQSIITSPSASPTPPSQSSRDS